MRFPLNAGSTRDIPPDAVLHESLLYRLRKEANYLPQNNHGGRLPPCLKHNGIIPEVEPIIENEWEADPDHQTYRFKRDTMEEEYEVNLDKPEQPHNQGVCEQKLGVEAKTT